MAWYMFNSSGTYQYRGKKCDGFENNKTRPKVNLDWGIDAFEQVENDNIKPYAMKAPAKNHHIKPIPGVFKKSQEEELEKIMKDFDTKKKNQRQQIRVMGQENPSDYYGERTHTEESSDRIRFLENSLLPITRRDTIGSLINQEKHYDTELTQSRMSRRSQSGNKKNESTFAFGDNSYNHFTEKRSREKDFYERMQEMYKYQDERKRRRVSQIQI